MDIFNLPDSTRFGRVVPKNAFDNYTNSKQKKLFTDTIQRITWTHKLSTETINLKAKEIQEIQVFKVELKRKESILKILEIINKSIPYHIVFWVEFEKEAYISTALKHPHPTNNDMAVIDWTFTSDWFPIQSNPFSFHLKGTLDAVFKDLCVQITGKPDLSKLTLDTILQNQQEIARLKNEIERLKNAISKSKQYNRKVDLNLKLLESERKLKVLER